MSVLLHTHRLQTLEQIRAFVEGSESLDIEVHDRQAAYDCVAQTLRRFGYTRLGKADKGLIVRYMIRVTGRSRQQITRLIAQFRSTGTVRDRRGSPSRPFTPRYTRADSRQLADLDRLHGTLSGTATRKLCQRAYHMFSDERFERLAGICNGHLYNLRQARTYSGRRGPVHSTRPTPVPIGERRRPRPDGQPGYLRVDSCGGQVISDTAIGGSAAVCCS